MRLNQAHYRKQEESQSHQWKDFILKHAGCDDTYSYFTRIGYYIFGLVTILEMLCDFHELTNLGHLDEISPVVFFISKCSYYLQN